jgi:predicted enzyme related to lactoylglutathione lyase
MPINQGSFIWYELITSDPKGAKAFYDAVVGWDIEPEPAGDIDYRMIRRSDGGNAGGVFRLTEEMKQHGGRPVWLGYIGVTDVEATVAAVERDGGKVMMPAWDIPYVGRLAMVTSPDGAPFYVMRPMPPEGRENEESDVFHPEEPQHVRWNELSTTDPAGAIAFYGRHFAWRQEGEMDMGELGKYQFLHHGETMIGAVMPKMPDMPVSMWSFYIGVDDIDRAHEAVKSGGGRVLMGPMEIPGGDYSLNGMDPQGAAFGLVGPRKS